MTAPTADSQLRALEEAVGHPNTRWSELQDRVQDRGIQQFAEVERDWLDLMWCLDQYRREGVPPRGMGDLTSAASDRLAAVYRGKGNWFATLVSLLLQNGTRQRVSARQRVQGFSQVHQIDLAWPAREEDVRVCAETKVTGAPPRVGTTRARGARSDYSNRRKELKFGATDLKLYRRQQETVIDHWGVWREQAPPKTYFLWAARLNHPRENVATLVREAKMLVDTYLDGAGIFAWRENDGGDAYQSVGIAPEHRVATLDDVLHRIAAVIKSQSGPRGEEPPVETPVKRAVAPEDLPDE